nr:DotD/TraH family lipoprotein [Methylomarinum sp. Ch1-1]MDP4523199.1 DotD/TraH family lipoprotein [Methylomarinum sp. Ch1-1]
MLLNISMKKRLVLAVAPSLLFMGCASKPTPIPVEPDNTVLISISESAKKIQEELNVIAKVEQHNSPDIKLYKRPEKGPLTKLINLRWHGDAVPAVETVAKLIGYEFDAKGKKPVVPAIIDIDAKIKVHLMFLKISGYKRDIK